jgi:hypothetical protein
MNPAAEIIVATAKIMRSENPSSAYQGVREVERPNGSDGDRAAPVGNPRSAVANPADAMASPTSVL